MVTTGPLAWQRFSGFSHHGSVVWPYSDVNFCVISAVQNSDIPSSTLENCSKLLNNDVALGPSPQQAYSTALTPRHLGAELEPRAMHEGGFGFNVLDHKATHLWERFVLAIALGGSQVDRSALSHSRFEQSAPKCP